MKIKLGSGSVSVNGVVYEGKGKVISILNNEVIIDGVVHGKAVALPEITVIVNGHVDSLHTELGNIIINGNAGMVKTALKPRTIYCTGVVQKRYWVATFPGYMQKPFSFYQVFIFS